MAAARRQEEDKAKEDKAEPVVEVSKEGGVEIDVTEPEDDDEQEEAQLSRREKKAQRQSLREQAESDRQARLEAEQRAAYALGVAQATVQQTQQRQQFKSPHEIEGDAIFKERELLVQEFQLTKQRGNGNLSPEQEQDFKRRGYNLEERMAMNAVAKREAMYQPDPAVRQQQDVMAVLRTRYPDVVGNQQAFGWALAKYQTYINHPNPRERLPDDWTTAERVMNETREQYGVTPQREAQPAERRYAGSPAGASGGRQESPKKISLSKEERQAADAAYGHLDPEVRYKRYAQVREKGQKKSLTG